MASSRIFVRNLPPNLTDEGFKSHFAQKRDVTDAKFIGHRRIGYVGYKTAEDAAEAVKYFDKSFIRMSRIAVELARPTTDSLLAPNRATQSWQNSKVDGNSVEYASKTENGDRLKQNPLKRKRVSAPNEDVDPKLREFLGVMQRPSHSKTWQNESVEAVAVLPSMSKEMEVESGVQEESEDEYQTISRRTKISVDHDSQIEMEKTVVESEPVLHGKLEVADTEQDRRKAGQSDADWLRSKTSRLLGLVENGEGEGANVSEDAGARTDFEMRETPQVLRGIPKEEVNAVPDVEREPMIDADEKAVRNSRRLFLRSLSYAITEDDLTERFGAFPDLEEVHVAMDSKTRKPKGFAYVQYGNAESAVAAYKTLDNSIFQGRILHILPAAAKRENTLDDFAISKLPLKQQRQIRRKAESTASSFSWNSLYMNTDAVLSSISARLGVEKSSLLDPSSADAAVKQALVETHVIQETRSYFAEHGVDLETFKSKKRGDTAILVKNFPYGTKPEELRKMFEEHGKLTRFLMPPSGTMAIVEFALAPEARAARNALAYRKMKDTILFLEPAPKDLFARAAKPVISPSTVPGAVAPKTSTTDLLRTNTGNEAIDTSTLFVRNLNFTTTTQLMTDTFSSLDGFISARVKTKTDPKKPGQILSMGFGFLEFRTKDQAQAALNAMNGYTLEGHKLDIRASQKAIDAGEERRKEDRSKASEARGTKIIIKNLPFEASKAEVRSLFGAYGQLRSVRVPKKFDSSTRGFAFADFSTPREAANAMDALRNTHLLGRRLVLEFAEAEAEDAEEEIERMQQKVGAQAYKLAAQKLAGAGRKKFNISGDDPEAP